MFAEIVNSWKSQSPAIRFLRLFLGSMFIYAGMVKVLDSRFLDMNDAFSLKSQLLGFSQVSPIPSVLINMSNVALLVGILTIFTELAIGVGTLLGVAPLLASLGGIGMSLMLWLTTSWNVRPIFLSSNLAYLGMWVALALAVFYSKNSKTK